jgi:hypothetical protein
MKTGKTSPKYKRTRRIHQNYLHIAMQIDSGPTIAFKLVALLACGVILES